MPLFIRFISQNEFCPLGLKLCIQNYSERELLGLTTSVNYSWPAPN